MATISIADNDARRQYTQAVTAGSTQLTIDFPFFDNDDINVIVTSAAGVDTTLSRGTGTGTFAVVGTAVDDGFSGGYITLGDTYSDTSTKFTIFRDIPVERTTDFPTSGPFNISSLNTELDKIFAIEQELETAIGRTMKLADSDTAASLTLPNVDTRKGTVLAFNSTSGLPEAGPNIGKLTTIAAIKSDIEILADIEDGTDATDAIQTVAGISTAVSNVSGISTAVSGVNTISSAVSAVNTNSANINTVAGIDSDVTDVANISGNVTTVAGIDSDVTTVAGDSTDIQTLADLSTEIGNLGTSANVSNMSALAVTAVINDMDALADLTTEIGDLGDITSDITDVAGVTSDVTTVAGQISPTNNISAVAGKATEIGRLGTTAAVADMATLGVAAVVSDMDTLADISSDITTVAGIDTDVTTVAGQISPTNNISTVAGDSTNIATVASNIAGVNSFAERYRVSASDPTTSLDAGDLAFVTGASQLKYYDGSAWQGISPGITAVSGDSSPALGGNLDVNGNSIVSASNGDIAITPNGTGSVVIDGLSHPQSDGTAGQFLKTDGSGQLSFATVASDLVDDTTPQLGGTLDTNGQAIQFGASKWTIELSTNDLIFKYNGTAKIKFASDGEIVTVDDVTAFGTI